MANRQVRLDPDVETLVAEVMAEEGLGSFSAATNTVLREVLTPTADGPATGPGPAGSARPPDRSGPPTAGPARARQASARASRGALGRPGARKAAGGRSGGLTPTRAGCPHPVSRRIGDRCANCGRVVG